jgi:hypothetical protein
MANFLKDFLDGLGSGLTNPKGVSGDFQHANKIFTDSNYRLAPKVKFLYHVVFNINPSALKTTSFDQNHKTQISLLVKSTDLPKFKISTDTVHKYNRKKQVQTRLDYDPVTIKFHDDNLGISTQLWSLYYGYYYADSAHGGSAGSVPKAGATAKGGFMGVMGSLASSLVPQLGGIINGAVDKGGSTESTVPAAYYRNTYWNETYNAFRYGLDNDSSVPFFSSIQIFQMARQTYQAYTLINPIITNWQHDNLDYAEGGTVENSMTINYEAVFYGQGAVSNGDPKGFAVDLYDRSPSPLSIAGGGNAALLGAGGVLAGGANVLGDLASGRAFTNPAALIGTLSKGANVLRNSKQLTKTGVKDELFSVVKSTAASATSGLLQHSFPKTGGTGQGNVTVARPYNNGEQ